MEPDGSPNELAVHAAAVAIARRALLIFGTSGAGKSRLAATLIAGSTPWRTVELVGDDRIVLRRTPRGLEARPHYRIAGFLERRGLGIVAMPWRDRVPVAGSVALGEDVALPATFLSNLPLLRLVDTDVDKRSAAVLAWWGGATSEPQSVGMTRAVAGSRS